MVSASTLDLDHCGASPLLITSLCPCQSRAVKTLTFSRHPSDIKLAVAFRRPRSGFRRSVSAFVPLSGDGVKSDGGWRSDEKTVEIIEFLTFSVGIWGFDDAKGSQDLAIDQLRKRVVFGLGLGLGLGIAAGGIVVARGWAFTTSLAAAVFAASTEYFEFVRSRGVADGMTPPPRYVSRLTAPMVRTLKPLLYHLVRMELSIRNELGNMWPILLGGQAHWTVGLVTTLMSISSIIAADTFAFLGERTFGRTPLTAISPKKTLEGAFAGLSGCTIVAIILSKLLCSPKSLLSASAFGILIFVGSLFGDLIESMIKRDAGVKDSGSLIPGHDTDSRFSFQKLSVSKR